MSEAPDHPKSDRRSVELLTQHDERIGAIVDDLKEVGTDIKEIKAILIGPTDGLVVQFALTKSAVKQIVWGIRIFFGAILAAAGSALAMLALRPHR